MRVWIVRALIVLGLSVLGYALYALLAPRGLGWIVWTLGGVTLAFVTLELVLRARRRAAQAGDEERWRAAIDEPRARRAAVAEVRSRVDRARRFGPRLRVQHARLATLLAELLEADGQPEAAIAALAKVPIEDLEPIEAAVLRHARAHAYLAAGDLDGAEIALSPLAERAGDDVLDAVVALARGAIALGRGRLEDAETVARAIAAHADDELRGEAQLLLAACLRARGDEEGARAALGAIPEAHRARLARVAPAVLREALA